MINSNDLYETFLDEKVLVIKEKYEFFKLLKVSQQKKFDFYKFMCAQ